jgi:hypothetical protein
LCVWLIKSTKTGFSLFEITAEHIFKSTFSRVIGRHFLRNI